MIDREQERRAVARGEEFVLATAAALPYRTNRVDHVARRQAVAARDLGGAGDAAAEHAAFVAAALDGAPVLVDAAAGRRALAAALAVSDSMAASRARREVSGLIGAGSL